MKTLASHSTPQSEFQSTDEVASNLPNCERRAGCENLQRAYGRGGRMGFVVGTPGPMLATMKTLVSFVSTGLYLVLNRIHLFKICVHVIIGTLETGVGYELKPAYLYRSSC